MDNEERLKAIEQRIAELESRTIGMVRLGPQQPTPEEEAEKDRDIAKLVADAVSKFQDEVPPVDRSCQILADGSKVPEDRSHTRLRPDGQQEGYIVLCPSERAKGFVRPYRDAYRHLKCGKITTMGRSIAETYSRDPGFYDGTFCVHCGGHFPIGEDGEFVWYEMDGSTGPKVGT